MLLENYIKEIKEDTIVNELNLKEKSLSLPALKAKWVARLINHKNTLNELEKKKRILVKRLLPQVKESLPVKLSDNLIKDAAEDTKEVAEISEKINEQKQIIEFLERTEKVMTSFTYDIGNIVKVIQLETL